MKVTWKGTWWGGKKSIEWEGTIPNLRKKIPTFTCEDFRIGNAVNAYKYLIVREPVGKVSLGDDFDSLNSERIPIQAVSKHGYKLVQHHDLLNDVLKTCTDYGNVSDIESLEAKLRISDYGARIRIELPIPDIKRDSYTLKVICLNSVDKSIALTIYLSLWSEGDGKAIPFCGFHHPHTKELDDGAVRDFLRNALEDFLYGPRDRMVLRVKAEEAVKDNLTSDETNNVLCRLNEEKTDQVINLWRFLEILGALLQGGIALKLQDEQRIRFTKLIAELHELVVLETEVGKVYG